MSEEPTGSPAAEEWWHRITAVHNDIHNTLKHINKKRSGIYLDKARTYQPGNNVRVDRRTLTIESENNRTLTLKFVGPFTVRRKVGSQAYDVETPDKMRLHKVIHTSLLKPFRVREGEDIDVDDDDEEMYFVVESIVNSCQVRGNVEY